MKRARFLPLVTLLLLAGPAPAGFFWVTNSNNAGAGSLRDALDSANASPGPHTISFDTAGHFSVNRTIHLTSGLAAIREIAIIGPPVAGRLTIEGAGGDPTLLLAPNAANLTVSLLDVTFSNNGSGALAVQSGVQNFTLAVAECDFRGNSAAMGGAFYSPNETTASFTDCEFEGNSAAGDGGAVWIGRGCSANFTGCTFSSNTADDGACASTLGGTLEFDDCGFDHNSATQGAGGFRVQTYFNHSSGTSDPASLRTTNCNYIYGRGPYVVSYSADITVKKCQIGINEEPTAAGPTTTHKSAMITLADSTLTMLDSSIRGNTVSDGDGGAISAADSEITLTNSSITGNEVDYASLLFDNCTATILNCSITENSSLSSTAGIYSDDSDVRIGNTIVAENTGATSINGRGPDVDGEMTSLGHNLIGIGEGTEAFVNGQQGDIVGTKASPINPMLGPDLINGGTTTTRVPLPGSPAIEAGDSSLVTRPPFAGTPILDQRGQLRIQGSRVDIGAVEFAVFEVTNTNDSGAGSLREAVSQAIGAGGAIVAFDDGYFENTLRTIQLTSGFIPISNSLVIEGPQIGVKVSGGNNTRVFDITGGGIVNIERVRVIDGFAISDGGGIRISGNGTTVTLDESGVSNSSALGNGGGLHVEDNSSLTVTNSTFSGNATDGDGGGIHATTGVSLKLLQCTISGNSADSGGGGVYVDDATTTILNCTLAENTANADNGGTAGNGGGLRRAGGPAVVRVGNTIIALNSDPDATSHPNVSGTFNSLGHNLIGNGEGSTSFINELNGDLVGTALTPVNPQLGALQLNPAGSPTRVHPLQNASPAKGGGDNALLDHGAWPQKPSKDQRGQNRVFGDFVDIGAVEYPNGDVVTLEAPDKRAEEQGRTTATLRVERSYNAGAQVVHLSIDAASTASTADYAIEGGSYLSTGPSTFDVTIPDGSKSVSFTIKPANDAAVEGDETLIISLAGGAGYDVDPAATNSRTITIVDNEFTVTSSASSGAGTLRHAINAANDTGGGKITIPNPLAITLGGTALTISSDIEIVGNVSTVDANGRSRVFEITSTGGGCAKIQGLVITGGSTADDGGGVSVAAGCCVEFRGCAITGCSAGNRGGGLSADGAEVTVVNSSIHRNTALGGNGGGIWALDSELFLTNATIAQNQATGSGGGVAAKRTPVALTNATVAENVADSDANDSGQGGGIFPDTGSTATLVNTVVALNEDTPGNAGPGTIQPDLAAGSYSTLGHNFISRNAGATAPFPAGSPNPNGDYAGTTAAPLDPQISAVEDQRLSYAFELGSVLGDHGDNAAVTEAKDQRGYNRILAGTVDIGAVEMAYLTVTNSSASGAGSLREVLATANSQGFGDIYFAASHFNVARTINLAASGELEITSSVTLHGPQAASKRVTISGAGNSRVLKCSPAAATSIVLENLTLTQGDTASHASADKNGAGLLVGDHAAVTLTNVDITNCATTASGGGVFVVPGGSLAVFDSSITDCTAGFVGGGIGNNGSISLTGTTLSGNATEGSGGGIYNAGDATANTSTISGNRANGDGGGIHFAALPGNTLYLSACTITENTADDDNNGFGNGGGIRRFSGSSVVLNTLVSGNRSRGGSGPDIFGALTSSGHNLIRIADGGTGFSNGINGDLAGTAAAPLSAPLGTLRNNGGRTLTHNLLPGNQAVDAGDPAVASGLTDQAGKPRVGNGIPDIGAVEYVRQKFSASTPDATAAEVAAGLPPQSARFRFVRDSAEGSLPVPLNFSQLFPAAAASDYAFTTITGGTVSTAGGQSTLIFNEGQTTAEITVTPVDDTQPESAENVVLALASDRFGELDATPPAAAPMVIADNDRLVSSGLESGAGTLREAIDALNSAGNGGTITFLALIRSIPLNSPLEVSSPMDIIGNTETRQGITLDGQGAAQILLVQAPAALTLRNLTLANGRSANGPALSIGGGSAMVENCLVTANAATGSGGAILASGGMLTLTNCTLAGNAANSHGGAIGVLAGTVHLVSCSILSNAANADASGGGQGGGIFLAATGSLDAKSCLIAANTATNDLSPDIRGGVVSLGHNLVGNNADATAAFPAGLPNAAADYVGTPGVPVNPLAGPLRENGGPTRTCALHCGSPALNRGAPAVSSTDQRGVARSATPPDIGAYELATETYEYWRVHEFPFDYDRSQPEDDWDGDNAANGLEFATGTDPTSAISRPLLIPTTTAGLFVVEFSFSPLAPFDFIVPKSSTDLVSWQTVNGNGMNILGCHPSLNAWRIRAAVPLSPAGKSFFRLELAP